MSKTTRNAASSKALEHLLPMPMPVPPPPLSDACQDLRVSVDRFCLLAGIEAIGEMLAADAEAVCGPRHARGSERRGRRWGTTTSELAFQGARVKLERPRVHEPGGGELSLPSFELLSDPELLHAWAMNLMVPGVSTRKYGRAVRLTADAGGDLPSSAGDGSSKSAVSRRFVALTRSKLKAWPASPLDELDLLVMRTDGLHVGDHVMVAAIGIDAGGEKHVPSLAEGARENTAMVQALLDNLIDRGLERPRLYIVDGAKALSKCGRTKIMGIIYESAKNRYQTNLSTVRVFYNPNLLECRTDHIFRRGVDMNCFVYICLSRLVTMWFDSHFWSFFCFCHVYSSPLFSALTSGCGAQAPKAGPGVLSLHQFVPKTDRASANPSCAASNCRHGVCVLGALNGRPVSSRIAFESFRCHSCVVTKQATSFNTSYSKYGNYIRKCQFEVYTHIKVP